MRRRRVIAVGAIVVVLGVVGVTTIARAIAPQTPSTTFLTATAITMDVRDSVAVSGSIRPVDTYALAFGTEPARSLDTTTTTTTRGSTSAATAVTGSGSWTVETVGVAVGDAVKAGDVLATADTSDADQALAVATANLAAAKARLAADEKPVTGNTKAKAKLGVTQAEQQLSQARSALSQTQASGRLAVSQASAVLNDAKATLARDTRSGAPAAVIAADEAAVSQASRSLASVRRQASSANSQASAQVAAAKLGVRSANLTYTGATNVDTTAAVEADRAAVVQAEGAVRDAQKTLDLATIKAPIDGIVSSVDIRPGDVVSGTVIRLRSAAVEVKASVTESDLPRLAVGQPVGVTVTALKAAVTGSVKSLDLASPTTSASGVVSYNLVIDVPSAPELVAPGMTVDVDVTTALAKGVVAVPVSALAGEPGAYTVRVVTGPGQARTIPVEVGLLTAEYAEVRSGLDAGIEVVTGTVSAKDLVQEFPGAGGRASGTASPAAKP
jgi:HlyD family secretion protein